MYNFYSKHLFNFLFPFSFARDIKDMIGHEPHKYWKIMWKYVAPVFIAVLLVATLISKFLKPITYSVYSYTQVIQVTSSAVFH